MIVRPSPIRDDRGFFVRTMDAAIFRAAGVNPALFVQENQSRSKAGTLRGLHFRAQLSERKLVRCARGRMFEAVVDLRPWSPTFKRPFTIILDDEDHCQLLVPAGCAHGFVALTDIDVCYHHDMPYEASLERAVRFDDANFAVDWPISRPLLSDRDRQASSFEEIAPMLAEWFGSEAPAQLAW